jgi:hypothetical protein
MRHECWWTIAGIIALLAAGAIAMTVKETKLEQNSSRVVALLFAAVAYYGLAEVSEIWTVPQLRVHWLQWAVPLVGAASIIAFVVVNREELKKEAIHLLSSSYPFIAIAVLAVFARYCFS